MLKTSIFIKSIAFTGLTASAVIVTNPAQAAIFTVNGTNYDITTVTGSYNANVTAIQASPWWGNQTLAQQAASVVAQQLGTPNLGHYSPFFAYAYIPSQIGSGSLTTKTFNAIYSEVGNFMTLDNLTYVYAVISPSNSLTPSSPSSAVPEPLTMLGAATAVGFGVNFKRRLGKVKQSQKDA